MSRRGNSILLALDKGNRGGHGHQQGGDTHDGAATAGGGLGFGGIGGGGFSGVVGGGFGSVDDGGVGGLGGGSLGDLGGGGFGDLIGTTYS